MLTKSELNMQTIVFDIDHTIFDSSKALREGVADLLAILNNLGFRLGAITANDHRALVRLDEAGIRHHFSEVFCSDHGSQPKSITSLHSLLERLGAELHQVTLISHAHADILLGKDAGVAKTIGISHGRENIGPLTEAGADRVIPSLTSVLDVLE